VPRSSIARCLGALLLGAGIGACVGPAGEGPVEGPVPDFALEDVNAISPSFGQLVSPRDYVGHVSAWYFGHAT
jgi:hypothetical protein